MTADPTKTPRERLMKLLAEAPADPYMTTLVHILADHMDEVAAKIDSVDKSGEAGGGYLARALDRLADRLTALEKAGAGAVGAEASQRAAAVANHPLRDGGLNPPSAPNPPTPEPPRVREPDEANEAERWIAAVATDGGMSGIAASRVRSIVARLQDKAAAAQRDALTLQQQWTAALGVTVRDPLPPVDVLATETRALREQQERGVEGVVAMDRQYVVLDSPAFRRNQRVRVMEAWLAVPPQP